MFFRPWLAIFLLLASMQTGCAVLRRGKKTFRSRDAATALARRPLQRLGTITLVNEAEGFVLIDSGALPTPATGAKLTSYSGALLSGQLKAGPARRRPFVVADILEGAPRRGDEIFEVKPAAEVRKPER